ncbi:MAG TPA: hypothetical protein VFR58_17310 [Flavisolibacter sp.]|nr:hypothetical protein [Flavisolibacter sp.]
MHDFFEQTSSTLKENFFLFASRTLFFAIREKEKPPEKTCQPAKKRRGALQTGEKKLNLRQN